MLALLINIFKAVLSLLGSASMIGLTDTMNCSVMSISSTNLPNMEDGSWQTVVISLIGAA